MFSEKYTRAGGIPRGYHANQKVNTGLLTTSSFAAARAVIGCEDQQSLLEVLKDYFCAPGGNSLSDEEDDSDKEEGNDQPIYKCK